MNEPVPKALRLFIAVTIPEEVKTEIEKAQSELRRAVPSARVRWTTREQFHLTLRFLGNVEPEGVEALTIAVRGACAGLAALELRAERIGFFPGPRRPRVVWAGIHDQEGQLGRVHEAVIAATQDFTTEPAEKEFTGHVTLGRIKDIKRSEVEALARLATGMAERFFGAWTADKVEIIRSELSPTGARYSSLAAIALLH